MLLHAERRGAGPPLTLVHGFTQTRRCWGPFADGLAADHEVILVDAPGHGESSKVLAGLRTGGRLIADAGGRGTYLGYSMGGRFCLHLALSNPELVEGLILLGATPGIEDPDERRERAARDDAMAALLESKGLLDFIRQWLDQPLFAGIPAERSFQLERMENTVDGLANSLRQAGTGAQDSRWDELPKLDMPVLVLAGEHDDKFAAIARRTAEAIGDNATLALVPGCGHATHLEDPDATLAVVRPWLAEHEL